MTNFGQPGTMPGILHPMFTNRFRFVIAGLKTITMQTSKVKIDMLRRVVEVEVEQPVGLAKDMLDDIYFLGTGSFEDGVHRANTHAMSIDLMDGADGVLASVDGYARLVNHELVLDYAVNQVAVHKLTFSYIKTV